jgi:hypothetical protein
MRAHAGAKKIRMVTQAAIRPRTPHLGQVLTVKHMLKSRRFLRTFLEEGVIWLLREG